MASKTKVTLDDLNKMLSERLAADPACKGCTVEVDSEIVLVVGAGSGEIERCQDKANEQLGKLLQEYELE